VKGPKTTFISILAIGLLAGSAVGVAAQDEEADPMAPSAFSGDASGDEPPEFYTDPETGLEVVVIPTFNMADPRASGTWTEVEDGADVEDGGLNYGAGVSSVRLANDGGAWIGTKRSIGSNDGEGEGSQGSRGVFTELVGEGGYEGLSLFMYEAADSEGGYVSNAYIIPTDMVPAMPPPPAAE
jgi:hypothetical protein